MTSVRVAIRVDASRAIGLGHVRRCVSLAKSLKRQGAAVQFVTRELDVDVSSMLGASEWMVHTLPPPDGRPWSLSSVSHADWAGVPAERDARETVRVIQPLHPDALVIDHYAFDADWHRPVAGELGCPIAVIDDLADRSLECDLLVDHNHHTDHAAKYQQRLTRRTRILGGPRFALVDPSFAEAPRLAWAPIVRSMGIFMGGVDAGAHTLLALRACRAARFQGPIEIVSTQHNPNLQRLVQAVAADGHARLTLDLPDLAAFFARHDLHVGAGGGATWERCCIGAPTVAVAVALNQSAVLGPLQELGVVEACDADADSIAAAVSRLVENADLRRAMGEAGRALVDGRGTERVAQAITETSC
jgi:UDP-2,4-diacetamido-2,4,6-trideoxy-beta-L-altropyranose hydrolase